MINPTEKKRRGYLMHFEEGTQDAVLYQQMNQTPTTSK